MSISCFRRPDLTSDQIQQGRQLRAAAFSFACRLPCHFYRRFAVLAAIAGLQSVLRREPVPD
jgi:hypothetical protein